MRKYIPYILSAWLMLGFTFLASEKVSSQSVNRTEAADSAGTRTQGTATSGAGLTSGRAKALLGGVVGLMSLLMGWRTKVRSAEGTGSKRTAAIVALVLGLTGILLSVLHLSTSVGAVFGSGSGKAGAIVALVLSLLGTTFGGLALRSSKTV